MTQGDGESLSLMVQVAGLAAAMVLTFLCRRKRWAPVVGPALGLTVNIVGQIGIVNDSSACVSSRRCHRGSGRSPGRRRRGSPRRVW